jgi:DNA repair protein RecO (recombination protein O)
MTERIRLETEAIVLKVMDYGESDRIVTFLTASSGKVRGIAKGARRSRRRFANALEPFCASRVCMTRRSPESLALIESCDVLSHFPLLREHLEKTLAASYLIDLADQFVPEEKQSEAAFCLLRDFLTLLEGSAAVEPFVRFFEIRLLGISGYAPMLDACLSCRTPVATGFSYCFDTHRGGLLCSRCRTSPADAMPVSLGTIRTLLAGRQLALPLLGRLHLGSQSADESRRLLAHFIRHLLGREPKSLQVLNEIRLMQL